MAVESTKTSDLERLAELIHQRNENEIEVTRIIGRPAQIGHVGEYPASAIFNIALEVSATTAGHRSANSNADPPRRATQHRPRRPRQESSLRRDWWNASA